MKTFDWKEASKQNEPDKLQWLKENHDKGISVEEFCTAMKKIRKTGNPPSKLKNHYNRLKAHFGFFDS